MKIFDWEEFKNNRNYIVVHCKTEEDANDFCKQMHEHQMKWCSGKSYLNYTNWKVYKQETCYSNHGTYGTVDCYETNHFNNYIILEYSDYFETDWVETIEEFILRTGRKVEYMEDN